MAKTVPRLPIGDPPTRGQAARKVEEPRGPFRAGVVREGDHREISHGYAILTMPGGGRHASGSLYGGAILDSDPATPGAGVDVGFSSDQHNLRAPDVAVTPHTDAEGWIPEYPTLAIEYAGKYQRENELQAKIVDMLAGGTQFLWVVRLTGEKHVEIHTPNQPMRIVGAGALLEAPGITQNPIRVEALWDRAAAHEHTLKNLLQRSGYRDLDAVLAAGEARGKVDGKAEGKAEAILLFLSARGLALTEGQRATILGCTDRDKLDRWTRAAATASTTEDVLS